MERKDRIKIGDCIKYERKKKGIRQKDLAPMLGIYRTTLSNYESNRVVPSLAMIQLIADKLSVPFHKLTNYKIMNPHESEEATSQHERDILRLEKEFVKLKNEHYTERSNLMKELQKFKKLSSECLMLISRYQEKFGPLKNN